MFAAVAPDGSTRMGRLGRALFALNPGIELYCYSSQSETQVRGFNYGGQHGCYGAKVSDANWLLRRSDGAAYITYGAGDGTFLPDRGAWTPQTEYALNDLVRFDGAHRKCRAPHTSSDTFTADAANWTTDLGLMAVNYLPGVLPEHNGEHVASYHAKYLHSVATRDMIGWQWAGAYLDSGIGYPDAGVALDWLNTGTDQRANQVTAIRRAMDEHSRRYVAALKSEFGAGFRVIGNCNGGALGRECLQTEGVGLICDGNLHEAGVAPSVSWSNLCIDGVSGGGNSVMESGWSLKTTAVKNQADHRSVLGVKPSTASDYQTARLGIAIALMQGGRAALSSSFDGSYTSTVPMWADEWDQPLGDPIDPPQALPFAGQIFRRRFQNGIVLLNQSKSANLSLSGQAALNRGVWAPGVDYGAHQHVTHNDGMDRRYICKTGRAHKSRNFADDFAAGHWHRMTGTKAPNFVAGAAVRIGADILPPGVYRRFAGTQDPAHNNGATVDGALDLAGWDAILLLCVTPGVHGP